MLRRIADPDTPPAPPRPWIEYALLALLALLWGSSYAFIQIALRDLPPVTLIAARVSGAALFLWAVALCRRERFPRDVATWRALLVQAICNSLGAWTLLAWGQQYVGAGLASVLNSTSPLFVFVFTALLTRHEPLGARRLMGAVIGFAGVVLVIGLGALRSPANQTAGELACVAGAALYGAGAIHGRRFARVAPVVTAAGTMAWAAAVLVPVSLLRDHPWRLAVSAPSLLATAFLSFACTGVALMIYFRLVKTIGSMGVASQSYLRAGVGVVLGAMLFGERFTVPVIAGLVATVLGVVLLNAPRRTVRPEHSEALPRRVV